MEKMKNLINGELKNSSKIIDIVSPIDSKIIGEIPSMNKLEVDYAIQTSKEAFITWSNLAQSKRSEYMHKIADELDKMKDEIANLMVKEIAKNKKASLTEIERTIDLIRYSAEENLRINGEVLEGGNFDEKNRNKISITRYKPYGVVLCIAPFNYPINLSASKIITALVGGNTVIFKPPTQGSISSLKFMEAIYKAKLPKGVINSITGRGSEIGDYLTTHKDIDFINFTGSTNIGKNIAKLVEMKPLIMELGGKDCAIVLEDANLKKTSKEIIQGAFNYSGQRCTAIKRVLVIDKIYDKFIDLLNEELKRLKVGTALDDNDVTELIDDKSANYIEDLIKETLEIGRKTNQEFKRYKNLIYPMIFYDVDKNDRIAIEEPFGPVLPIIKISSVYEAIEIANSSEYGLQSSVFTKDIDKAFMIADKLEVGTVHINNKTQRGPDNFPFLGYKNSGIGVQGIKYSIMSMLRLKTIVFDIMESDD